MAESNIDRDAKIFNPSKNPIEKGNIRELSGNFANKVYKRIIADDIDEDDIESFKKRGCLIKHRLRGADSFDCPDDILSELKAELNIREARVFQLLDLEADQQIQADRVWDEGTDGTGVNVVVLDTGIDSTHTELSDSILGCESFVEGETCEDADGHGTHVAGIITSNGIREIDSNYATGVAPGAGIYMLKVCGDYGCYEDDMMAAMEYAVSSLDAEIMSISIGGGNFGSHCDSDPLAQKVNWVVDNGFTVVIAAGNDGSGVDSPACASGAIAVGAVDKSGVVPYWSNRGTALDIVGSGVDILSTYSCLAAGDCSSEWYAYMSGTSMSAPQVSGTISLLLDANPDLTDEDIKDALYSTADSVETCYSCRFLWGGRCFGQREVACTQEIIGAGIVNAYEAYLAVKPSEPECIDNLDCSDGLWCSGDEICQDGTCQPGTPPDCSMNNILVSECFYVPDGIEFTYDYYSFNSQCDEDSDSCTSAPSSWEESITHTCNITECGAECEEDADCDDSDELTQDTCLDECTCENTPIGECTTDQDCDDGLYCNGEEACIDSQCQPGIAPDCSDGVGCTEDSCNEDTDSCYNTPNNGLCDDGLWCNGAETCDPVSDCQPGTPVNCDDTNECTEDSCNEGTDSCDNTQLPDNTECTGGICCSGTCSVPACSADTDCDDYNACTADSCTSAGTCSASCSYSDITACISGDGCCPEGCSFETDSDCPSVVKCWDGSNTYLTRSSNQLSKFCRCAEGDYDYSRYSLVWGRMTAYEYVDSGNNENWQTGPVFNYLFPAYRVQCADGNWYYADQDHYR